MKNHYDIRLNVLSLEKGLEDKIWRIYENGVALGNASHVIIKTESYTSKTFEKYPDNFGRHERWNIACDGYAVWNGTEITIVSYPI